MKCSEVNYSALSTARTLLRAGGIVNGINPISEVLNDIPSTSAATCTACLGNVCAFKGNVAIYKGLILELPSGHVIIITVPKHVLASLLHLVLT